MSLVCKVDSSSTHPIYSPPAPSKSTSGRCCLWWPQGHILIHLNSSDWTVPTPHPPDPHPTPAIGKDTGNPGPEPGRELRGVAAGSRRWGGRLWGQGLWNLVRGHPLPAPLARGLWASGVSS